MGFMNKLLGREEEEEDLEEEFDEGFEEEVVEEEPVEEDDGPFPFENSMSFFRAMIELDGFADEGEFAKKAAMYRIQRSPLFRDRIENGVESMNMITGAIGNMQEVKRSMKGEDKGPDDLNQQAQKLRNANKLIDQVDKFSGKEDAYVQKALGIGQKIANNIAENRQRQGTVASSVERSEEDI